MADLVTLSLRYLHILFAIAWIGAVLYGVGVLRVALPRAPMEARKEVLRHLLPVATHYVPMSAILTILFGTLLYLYMGRFNPSILVGTPWGLALLVAFVLTVGTFAFGMVFAMGAARRIQPHLEESTCEHQAVVAGLQRRFNLGQMVVLGLGILILGLMVYIGQVL